MRAVCIFSSKISTAVCSKEAARSAICWSVKRFLRSDEGCEIGTFAIFWTVRRKAVFRPEKLKSRGFSSFGWGKRYFWRSPGVVLTTSEVSAFVISPRAALEIEGPPG